MATIQTIENVAPTTEFDLDAYFRRIGYTGPLAPTPDTLRAIIAHHTRAIPFENLNPLLRWPVRLDIASLQEKLVTNRRGGYCFEQNLLLSHALRALGFRVTNLIARVLWNMPEETRTPRTHMLLRVDINAQPYLADVGFGGMTLTGALRLQPGVEQATPHEPYRVVEEGAGLKMQAKIKGEWKTLYRFDLEEQHMADYVAANWYVSTYPASHFTSALSAARIDNGRRYALRNGEFVTHILNGDSERRVLATVSELKAVLEEPLGLALPYGPELDSALQRVLDGSG